MPLKILYLVCVICCVHVVMLADELKLGDQAPNFSLPYATKDSVYSADLNLADFIGKGNIILAFYPADWSGGCTKEMCTMRDNFEALSELGALVFGISGDYVYSHKEWASRLNLQFGLLSDHEHSVAKMFGSFNPETGYNKRMIYVIGSDGRITYIDRAYKANSTESFNNLKEALKGLE